MGIQLGDLRKQLKNDLGNTLDGLLIQYEDKWPEYFIIVHSYWDYEHESMLRSRLYIALSPGAPMLGTMCFHVNNKDCSIRQVWSKPLDGPQWEKEGLLSDEEVESVGRQAVETGTVLHD